MHISAIYHETKIPVGGIKREIGAASGTNYTRQMESDILYDGRADDPCLRCIIFSSASSVLHSADIIVLVLQKKIVWKQQKIVLRCKTV